jgi:hypothetical protein
VAVEVVMKDGAHGEDQGEAAEEQRGEERVASAKRLR